MSDLNISAAGEVITPENAQYRLAVRITFNEGTVEAAAPKRIEELATMLWRLRLRWTGLAWQRQGVSQDIGVELAYLLLAEGFPLRVPDEAFRQRILAGDYEPEVTRNVRLITEGGKQGWYSISWCRVRDETYYQRSTSLAGARWSKTLQCVIVPPDAADEVEDFAKLHDFTISEAARSALDAQRSLAVEKLRLKIKPRKVRNPLPVGQVDPSLVDDSQPGDGGAA
jgi:hypothetical protein